MAKYTLYNKVWDQHKVARLATGQDQLFIALHLIHEVTTPQAFASMRARGESVAFPDRTFATMDHIIPTQAQTQRPFQDHQAELMAKTLEDNVNDYGIPFFDTASQKQGIVHVIGPELGLTQPGMTIACGDSHTSTHGAFGSLGFGIGTTQVGLVLETQTLALSPFKVRKIAVTGVLQKGVYAKDVILKIIQHCGVKGGLGYAYEFAGTVFDAMSMEERMTVCNMSIEGGARIGYVNPDQTTINYLKGRPFSPKGEAFQAKSQHWLSMASDAHAQYDDTVSIDGSTIRPMLTWGINPGQSVSVDEPLPEIASLPKESGLEEAYQFMKFKPGAPIKGQPVNVAFIGSCTNSRLSDLREAAQILKGKRISSKVRAIIVPGSQAVRRQAENEGLADIFQEAGAQWREAGCSMCLAMNPDKLEGDEICASTSNRNFIGRQGSPTGRTLLMSPAMAAAAAVAGEIVDVREWLS